MIARTNLLLRARQDIQGGQAWGGERRHCLPPAKALVPPGSALPALVYLVGLTASSCVSRMN